MKQAEISYFSQKVEQRHGRSFDCFPLPGRSLPGRPVKEAFCCMKEYIAVLFRLIPYQPTKASYSIAA